MTISKVTGVQTPYPQPLVPDVLSEDRMTPEALAIPLSEVMKASGRDEHTTLDELLAEIDQTRRAGRQTRTRAKRAHPVPASAA